MTINYTVPNYVKSNGGKLEVNFIKKDSYLNVITNNNSYTYPSSVAIIDENGISLNNFITYYSVMTPNCMQKITIDICQVNKSCPSYVKILFLRKSFTPLSNLSQILRITTVSGDRIAEK
jgi:hypothetical protein